MPPQLAALICILFILYLFWRDRKKIDGPSNALWIPLAWMFLAGSRYVSRWLNLSAPISSSDAYAEGSPIDAAVFFLLIAAGLFILSRRKIDWGRLLSQNKWIWFYLLYCGISIAWSDYPFVSFKRWIKEIGNPVMVLVILTEKRPYEALGVILRRLAFLFLPLSVLFIKYYPALGRAYHTTGAQMFTGVTDQKNTLGMGCLILGIYFSWNFFLNRKRDSKLGRGNIIDLMLVGMGVWLLDKANSATSLTCMVVAVCIFLVGRLPAVTRSPQRILVFGIAFLVLIGVLEMCFGLKEAVLEMLGRDATLTTRVPMWEVLRGMAVDPIAGAGYQSFWLGERGEIIGDILGAQFNQAHNGYLEQYLNLGYIGVAFIAVILLSGLLKVRRHLNVDYPSAMLRLCFIVTAVLYNYTEASFYGINNMWLLTLFGIIEIPDHEGPISKVQDRDH